MKVSRIFTVFAAILMFVGCKHEVIEPESIDEDFNVTYYVKPPHYKEKQGYLYAKGSEASDFIELASASEPPFTLVISVSDKKGQEALDFIKNKEDSPISSIQDMYPGREGTAKTYRVVTSKYFQSRHFFVSECYRTEQSTAGNYDISVQPLITVKMNPGQDIKTIEDEYRNVIHLKQENEDGTFLFSCNYKTSYEVLMLTTHIFEKIEVAWAEPSLQGTIYIYNK